MYQQLFTRELQNIQCDLSSGIKTLGQVQQMLSEEDLPNHYYDMLYVLYHYMRGIHRQLVQCIQAYEQREDI